MRPGAALPRRGGGRQHAVQGVQLLDVYKRQVLPSLRANGIYITDPLVKQFARDPDFAHAVVDALYELSLIHI